MDYDVLTKIATAELRSILLLSEKHIHDRKNILSTMQRGHYGKLRLGAFLGLSWHEGQGSRGKRNWYGGRREWR